jgi:hypothetical protein
MEGDHLGIMGVLFQDFAVGIDVSRIGQPGDGETIPGTVDILGTFDGIFMEVVDRREVFSLVRPDFDRGERCGFPGWRAGSG